MACCNDESCVSGTKTQRFPDGTQIEINADGSIVQTNPDGSRIKATPCSREERGTRKMGGPGMHCGGIGWPDAALGLRASPAQHQPSASNPALIHHAAGAPSTQSPWLAGLQSWGTCRGCDTTLPCTQCSRMPTAQHSSASAGVILTRCMIMCPDRPLRWWRWWRQQMPCWET